MRNDYAFDSLQSLVRWKQQRRLNVKRLEINIKCIFGQTKKICFILAVALNTAFLIFLLMITTKYKATYPPDTEDSSIQGQTNLLSKIISRSDNPKINVNITHLSSHTRARNPQSKTFIIKGLQKVSGSFSVAPTTKAERKFTSKAPSTTKAVQQESAFYRELKQRRKSGYFENILLKYLLDETQLLHLPKFLCGTDRRLIVLVTSSCTNIQLRRAIRETWGNDFQKQNIKVVFFVGHCPGAREEISDFSDIVEVDFKDSYYNNTLKSLARYRWFNQFCSDLDAVLLVDDDVMINVDLLLKDLPTRMGYSAWCMRLDKSPLFRNNKSKWYVPEWALRDKYYPPYCAGFAYIVSASAMSPLLEASLEIPYISSDDAIFTGYAADMIGLERNHDHRFSPAKDSEILCDKNADLASHSYDAEGMREIWKSRSEKCRTRLLPVNNSAL